MKRQHKDCKTCGGSGTVGLWHGSDPDVRLVESPCPKCRPIARRAWLTGKKSA